MEQLVPVLMKYVEDFARPHVQEKVTEEVEETRGELKQDLPQTILDYIKSADGLAEEGGVLAIIAKVISNIDQNDFLEKLKRITNVTVDTAADGMDLLLTNGVMNVAKGVLTKATNEEGQDGFNLDFLKSGKEGMVSTTMVLSLPVIKQVRENMGRKISAHLPEALGKAIQERIDEHGGSGGILGLAAGVFTKFLDKSDDSGSRDGSGGEKAGIQEVLQRVLSPKILEIIQPYLDKFENKTTGSLEGELRNKVFSVDYMKQKVMSMLTGGDGDGDGNGDSPFGSILSAFINKAGNSEDGGKSGGGGKEDAMNLLGSLASQFLKNRSG